MLYAALWLHLAMVSSMRVWLRIEIFALAATAAFATIHLATPFSV